MGRLLVAKSKQAAQGSFALGHTRFWTAANLLARNHRPAEAAGSSDHGAWEDLGQLCKGGVCRALSGSTAPPPLPGSARAAAAPAAAWAGPLGLGGASESPASLSQALGIGTGSDFHTRTHTHTHTHTHTCKHLRGGLGGLTSRLTGPASEAQSWLRGGHSDMRGTFQTHLLAFSLLCLLSKVCAQLCPTPCACPWPPPQCPPGVPLVLDGCNCCRVCARRLGEPCDHLHVCDPSQGLVCQPGAGPGGRGAVCLWGEDDGSCEVNGRLYRDGETFQPHCRLRCRCEDGGFTCVPLCSEDVRLPSWDCPHPRRVEVPGRCCPEWVCDQGAGLGVQPLPAQGSQFSGLVPPPAPGVSCPEWSTAWGPCSTTCGLGVATRVSNQNRFCRLETQRRLCVLGPCPPARGLSPRRRAF